MELGWRRSRKRFGILRYLGALFGNLFLKGYATDDSDQRVGYILDFLAVQITYVGMLLRV